MSRAIIANFLSIPYWYVVFDTENYLLAPGVIALQLLASADLKMKGRWLP